MLTFRLTALILVGLLVGGCASQNQYQPIYQWQSYQDNIDAWLRPNKVSAAQQTQNMLDDLQKIESKHGLVPPGYRAHLGLLYLQQGQPDQFAEQLQAEKQAFPESSDFVDFLLRNFKKKDTP